MRRARPGTKLPAMENRKINLNLELELNAGQLSGRVHEDDGAERAFSGWLGLIGAIDALVGDDADTPLNRTSNDKEPARAQR
jgi:hypothetical protein